jgi:hypothetical protein
MRMKPPKKFVSISFNPATALKKNGFTLKQAAKLPVPKETNIRLLTTPLLQLEEPPQFCIDPKNLARENNDN